MVIDCSRCGTANDPEARFCGKCGASLVTRVGVHERRVVTALFADLVRSTTLGESLDPEVVRGMVGRFFELATAEIERFGGTVEKFSGDAVMAVFGIPLAHEDDPERAVRAAIAIRNGVAVIAQDTRERHGVELQARIGIESGEVVVGDPFGGATMATGDAMNVAARLEQAAEPTEIVIGPLCWEQVRGLVEAEPMGELSLRGHDAAVQGWRVQGIAAEVGRPRGLPGLEAPLTGRDEELNLLLESARRVEHERKAALFTILGVPGVGKSRLVREATSRLSADGWSVVKGRCLPYGEGITYWPVAEMLRSLAGIDSDTSAEDAEAALLSISPAADVAEPLATALGVRDASQIGTTATDRDVAYAFRQLVEHLGATRRQVLIFEDIHWAEPALLDLIEHLVTWTRDAPLLVICPSRPELQDTRPSWGAGRMESARIQLEPLTESESRSMLSAMLTMDDLPAALRQRVLDRAEGNPLFVEEVVRLLIEEGTVEHRDGHWHAAASAGDVRVPESIEALIRARLDTLPAKERVVLQAASVVGRVFQRSAVAAISSPTNGGGLQDQLDDAVLRDLITQEQSPDREPTFRFRHILIRDVAYGTLPKARRAELHRDVAAWLRAWAGPRIDEFVEIEAFHLEQAVTLKRELDGRADAVEVERAVAALLESGDRAMSREDEQTALGFAERALALDPGPDQKRLEVEWLRVDSLRVMGELGRVEELAIELEHEAERLSRTDIQGRAILARAQATWLRSESADLPGARVLLERARELLTEAGDDGYLSTVLATSAFSQFFEGHLRRSEQIWTQYTELARSNGWPSREAIGLIRRARMRREFADVVECRRLLTEAQDLAERGPSRVTRLAVQLSWGQLLMFESPAEEAELEIQAGAAAFEEIGERDGALLGAVTSLGRLELWRDRPAEALAYFRKTLRGPLRTGDSPESHMHIARALLELGEVSEATRIIEEAHAATPANDPSTIASTSMVLGLAREATGDFAEAEDLLRKALAKMESTDFNTWEYNLSLAEFLLRRGRTEEGRQYLARSVASAAPYGPASPVLAYVERRGARAAAIGGSAGG